MPTQSATRSRHVMLYGPPAAGKLTVATTLADTTGYRLLDNHLTVDIALRLFEWGTEPHAQLVTTLRLALFRAAAAEGIDVVSTFVYAAEVDDAYVRAVTDSVVRALLECYDCYGMIEGTTLSIDNTDQSADAVAERIRSHLTL